MLTRPKWLTKAVQLSQGQHITIGKFKPDALYMRMGAQRGQTIEGYVYLNNIAGKQVFVSRWVYQSPIKGGGGFMITIEDGIVCGYLNTTDANVKTTKILKANTWYHIALTLDYRYPFPLSIYIDGALSGTAKMQSISGWKETLIGATKDLDGKILYPLDGYIGSVSLWPAWHNQEEILLDMHQPDGSRIYLGAGYDFSKSFSVDISPKMVPFALEGGATIVDAPGKADGRIRNEPGSKQLQQTNSITLYKEGEAPKKTTAAYIGYYLGGPRVIGDSVDINNIPFSFEIFFKAKLDANGRPSGGALLSNIAVTNVNGLNSKFKETFYFFSSTLAITGHNKIRFGIADNTTWNYRFIESNYEVIDNLWHHVAAVKTNDKLLIYIDGVFDEGSLVSFPLPQDNGVNLNEINFDTLFLKVGANTKNYFSPNLGNGSGLFPLALGVPEQFSGKIGEFRVWKKALTNKEVLAGMTKLPTGHEPGLSIYNTFKEYDPEAKARHDYKINSIVGPPIEGMVIIEEDGPQLQSSDSSYLIVQTNLMEDYSFLNEGVIEPTTHYRAVITAKTYDGHPIKNETITIQTVHHEPALLSDQVTSANNTELSLQTNASGQVSFSISADFIDELFAPSVRAQAAFMGEHDWTIISVDRHAHHLLSTLTGDMIQGRSAIGHRKNEQPLTNMTDDAANALANSISHLMSTVKDHSVHSFNPNKRRDNLDHDVIDHYFQEQKPHPYENAFISDKAFSMESDVSSSYHAVHEGSQETESHIRMIKAQSMPNPHWSFRHNSSTNIRDFKTYETVSEVHDLLENVPMAYINEAAEFLHPQGTKKRNFSTRDFNESLQTNLADDSWFDWLHDVVKVSEDVFVHTASHLIEEAKKEVHVIVVTATFIIGGVKKAVTAVVQKVEHIAKIAKALFKKLGAEAANVIHFIKSIFKWSDIILTQKYAEHHIDQLFDYITHYISQEKDTVIAGINTVKGHIDTQLSDVSNALLNKSINGHQAKASYHPPHGVQKGYLHRLISNHLASPNTQFHFENSATTPAGSITEFAAFKEHLGALFQDPEKLVDEGLSLIVNAVKALLDKAIELIKAGLEKVFELLAATISEIRSILTTKVTIPILSPLYKYITDGDEISILSLISLAGALPFTLVYKAVHNAAPPFTQVELDVFLQKSYQDFDSYYGSLHKIYQRSRSESPVQETQSQDELNVLKATWVVGYIFSTSLFVQGILTTINDVKIRPPLFITGGTGIAQTVVECITQILAFPFTIFQEEKSGPWALDMSIWFYQWAPLTVPFRKQNPVSNGEGLAWRMAFGSFHLLSFTALGLWEIAEGNKIDEPDLIMKMVANVASTVPEIDGVLAFDPEGTGQIAKGILDEVMFLAWSGLTVARTSVDIRNNSPTVCR